MLQPRLILHASIVVRRLVSFSGSSNWAMKTKVFLAPEHYFCPSDALVFAWDPFLVNSVATLYVFEHYLYQLNFYYNLEHQENKNQKKIKTLFICISSHVISDSPSISFVVISTSQLY